MFILKAELWDRGLPSPGSFPKWSQQPELGQARAKTLELSSFPCGCRVQAPSFRKRAILHCSPRCVNREGRRPGLNWYSTRCQCWRQRLPTPELNLDHLWQSPFLLDQICSQVRTVAVSGLTDCTASVSRSSRCTAQDCLHCRNGTI